MKENLRTAQLILQRVWKNRPSVIVFMCLEIVFSVIAPLGGIILPSAIIDTIAGDFTQRQIVGRMILLFSIIGLVEACRNYLATRNQNQYIEPRTALFWKEMFASIVFCDYQTYMMPETKKLLEKGTESISSNVDGVEGFFKDFTGLLTSALGLILYGCIITTVRWWILLVLLLLSLASYGIYLHARRNYDILRDEIAENAVHIRYFGHLSYDTAAGKDIRLYQIHPLLKTLFENANTKARRLKAKRERNILRYEIATEIISCLRDIVCYGYLIYLMTQNAMSIAEFVLYLGVVSGFSSWFVTITQKLAKTNTDLAVSADYFRTIDVLKPHETKEILEADSLDIVFDHVSFCYPDSDHPVLKDFCLHIAPNEKIGLVGVNGAGKTTLVLLLCGLYRPTAGRILVNGKDLTSLEKGSYHKYLGVIFQDAAAPSFTIGEIISSTKEGAYDEKEINKALMRTGLWEKVNWLPKGIHTYLNKDIDAEGVQLSGGEMQKLFLARALFHDPKMLILDEPTAAMDAISEKELYMQYDSMLKNHNAVFISHRLASTRFCDRIVLLSDGRILEQGTHEELMAKKGQYYEMFSVQSQYYQEEGAAV